MRTIGTSPSACANIHDVVGGRKTTNSIVESGGGGGTEGGAVLVTLGRDDAVVFEDELESVPSLDSEDSDEEESEEEEEDWESEEEEYDEEDAELDEGLAERLRILADARALKTLAAAFLHPEAPVKTTDGAAFGRNYFERPSAPERMEDEDADEEVDILQDALMLKEAAAAYLHPERPVVVDPTVFGRNWFNRPSAPEVEEMEEAEERARILAEAAALKKSAVDYMHPEVGVKTASGECFGRNYFERPSAPEMEEDELADERAEILEEMAALKKAAVDYMHPEVGVKGAAGECFGRNYFQRPSAPEVEDMEEAEERACILAEASALKQSAMDYMHPEVGVTTSAPENFGRNYFNRPSAPETEEDEFADERADILADALALKQSAMDYMHPEVGVTSSAGVCFGRNYFERPSAPEVEDMEEAEERARVLAEASALKKSAADYMHPEVGVTATEPTLFGRNYFNRPSAPETEDDEFADERADILADALALKQSAMDYMHPEVGVTSTDGACFGRNYFSRYSALETEDAEDEVPYVEVQNAAAWLADERARILSEASALKQSAMDYMHPEVGVTESAPENFGRNYFNRASAPETEDDEFADERADILADALALKQSAMDYMHPEVGVTSSAGACFGRNYFERPSAPEVEDMEEAAECARILAEASALKKSAMDYMHPEVGVTATEPTLFGRNYFNRASAPETEDDEFADERAEILEEVAALKKLAADYMHPEVGVTSADGACFGRNYFERPSAPEVEDMEEAIESAAILADALALKKSAADYLHPEVGVTATEPTLFGRNYFNRPSAPDTEDAEEAEERALVLAEAAALKKSAADYMHPEVGVTSADGACFGRNFFERPSAPETETEEEAEERAHVLAEAAALKKSAVDYMHPEVGVTATDPTVFGRNYFSRYSAPGSELPKQAPKKESKEVAAVKDLAAAVKGANLPSTKSTKLSSADGDFNTTKKSVSTVNLFGLSEEAF